jgi:hypothetical protein
MPRLPRIVATPVDQPIASANAYGAGAELAGAQIGRAITQVSETASRLYAYEQHTKAQALASRALGELQDYSFQLNDLEPDYNKHAEMYQAKEREIFEKYRGQIGLENFVRVFDEDTLARGARIRWNVDANVRERQIDASKASLDEMELAELEMVEKDPTMGDASFGKLKVAWTEQAANGVISQQERVHRESRWKAAATEATNAKQLETKVQMEALEILAGGGSTDEMLAKADRLPPEIANKVWHRVKSRAEWMERERKDAAKGAYDSLYPQLDALIEERGPEDAYLAVDRSGLPDKQKTKLYEHVDRRVRREEKLDDTQNENIRASNYALYTTMRDNAPEKFRAEDLNHLRYIPGFETQAEKLIQDQQEMRQGRRAPNKSNASAEYDRILAPEIEYEGKSLTPESKQRKNLFLLRYDEAYQRFSREEKNGKALTAAEETKLASDILRPMLVEEQRTILGVPLGTHQVERRIFELPREGDLPPAGTEPTPAAFGPYDAIDQIPEDVARRADAAARRKKGGQPTVAEILAEANRLRTGERPKTEDDPLERQYRETFGGE